MDYYVILLFQVLFTPLKIKGILYKIINNEIHFTETEKDTLVLILRKCIYYSYSFFNKKILYHFLNFYLFLNIIVFNAFFLINYIIICCFIYISSHILLIINIFKKVYLKLFL